MMGVLGNVQDGGDGTFRVTYYGIQSRRPGDHLCELLGGTRRQVGDFDLSFSVPYRDLTEEEGRKIRAVLEIQKLPQISEETRERLREHGREIGRKYASKLQRAPRIPPEG